MRERLWHAGGLKVPVRKVARVSSTKTGVAGKGQASPRPRDWDAYLERAPVASAGFMAGVEDLPVQER